MYYSSYADERLVEIADDLAARAPAGAWCVFDNTASGAALGNALAVRDRLGSAADLSSRRDAKSIPS
jgi:uncharacterized protein YecE (DUF72 family)